MRTFRLIGIALLALLLCTSCDLIQKKENKSEDVENFVPYDYSIQEPKRTVVSTFTVKARIYKMVQVGLKNYDKATNHYTDLEITLYSDGDAFCTYIHSESRKTSLQVRDSMRDGYDFECNNGRIIYKFNTNEMF